MVKAKARDWRPRAYGTIDDLGAELDRIQAAHDAGILSTTGNWSTGQILEHCGKLMRFSFDGFEARAPLALRLIASVVFKPRLGRSHMKPGIKLPKEASSLLPTDGVSFDDGMLLMRAQLARIDGGERMTRPSPILGKMTHEQWVLLHLDHCRLHYGFVQVGES